MRSMLIVLAVGGNIVVWGIAYVGYVNGRGDNIADFDTASGGPAGAQLQLLTLQTPTRARNGRRGRRLPISITLDVPDVRNITYICQLTPKIRDAMVQILFRNPPQYGAQRDIDFSALAPRLLATTNQALGREYVAELVIDTGSRKPERRDGDQLTKMRNCAVNETINNLSIK